MKKALSIAIIMLATTAILSGCFKQVVAYTVLNVAIYEQTEQDGPTPRAQDIFSYAYYVDTLDWRIASWEDALAGRITNKTTGEVRSAPDVLGEFNSSDDFQVSIEINQKLSMVVAVDPVLKVYAYRKYELPVNLDRVEAKLYLSSWKRNHTNSGWWVVNPFYGIKPETTENEQAGEGDE